MPRSVIWVKFDRQGIEIIDATDKQIEQFAIQAGNDTDPYRQPRYKKLTCQIAAESRLTENTIRILESTFGQVAHQ